MAGGWRGVMAGLTVGGIVLFTAGCATFTDQPEDWQPQDQVKPQSAPEPEGPGGTPGDSRPGEPRPRPSEIPPPNGCVDFDPAVIATCLDKVTAVAALPGDGTDPTAIVGERGTGRILRVKKGAEPQVVAVAPVDATTDGGLTGLALSPTFGEDQLIFAYITTPTDNRLVRIAPGDTPKPVLTGIPRGATGNRGALALDHRGALLLATGDAGNPALARDPASLAGKVLRIDSAGQAAAGNPNPGSAIVAEGLRSPGGVCASMDGALMWVTDRGDDRDLLYRLELGKPLRTPAWTWPDSPGVSGCAATADAVWVVTGTAGDLQTLPLADDGSFSGKPIVTMAKDEGVGRWGGLDLVNERVAIGGTVNKDGGKPVSSDDRALVIVLINQGGGRGPD